MPLSTTPRLHYSEFTNTNCSYRVMQMISLSIPEDTLQCGSQRFRLRLAFLCLLYPGHSSSKNETVNFRYHTSIPSLA
jgi:hypothetical protein